MIGEGLFGADSVEKNRAASAAIRWLRRHKRLSEQAVPVFGGTGKILASFRKLADH